MEIGDFEHGARFVNKLWNSARFLLRYTSKDAQIEPLDANKLDVASKWLVEEFAKAADDVEKLLSQFRVNEAINRMYHFTWGSYCDWGLECAKEALSGSDQKAKNQTVSVLVYVFEGILRFFSPVMPFITEELWHRLPSHPAWQRPESLVIADYPDGAKLLRFREAGESWALVQDLITGIRSTRALAQINPKDTVDVHMRADVALSKIVMDVGPLVKRLATVGELRAAPDIKRPGQSLVTIGKGFEAYIPASGIIDIAAEKKRLSGERDRVSKVLVGLKAKLDNPNFADRAPEDVVQQTREQLTNMTSQLKSLEQNLEALS
ncbi:MAG: class I tRNA ligase family protein [bacterium]